MLNVQHGVSRRAALGCIAVFLVSCFPSGFGQLDVEPSLVIQQTGAKVELHWTDSSGQFAVEQSATLGSSALWLPVTEAPRLQGNQFSLQLEATNRAQYFRLRQEFLPSILETSPADGETGVAVTRETVLRFSAPLAENTMLTVNQLRAEYGGRRILSRVELSTDRKTATLFYTENLPASARINVALDSAGLKNSDGQLLDGDNDGVPGGVFTTSFSTIGNTPLPNTGVIGKVYAAEITAGGTNRPLKGATVTVDGAEQTLRTVTDADGSFHLYPSPSGRFFVHVDGRTAVGSTWPNGAYYPFVGKAWEAIPGKSNNLAGGNGEIFLPLIQSDALRPVSTTTDTIVTMSPSVVATNPAFAGVSITVPANDLFSDNGTRGGKVGIAPVPADRLPEPLPPGLNIPLVITIQTDGPSNFDRPVPVRFPNLPDPLTGEKLPPGAKTMLWSFNHDTGRWEPQGTATVTADGNFAETDPGVGVRQPGWHGLAGGCPGSGPGPDNCTGPDCPCYQKIRCEIPVPGRSYAKCMFVCVGNVPKQIFGGGSKTKRTPFETGLRCIGGPGSCPNNPDDTLDPDRRKCMDQCTNPQSRYITYTVPCEGFTSPCPERQSVRASAIQNLVPDRFEEQERFWEVEGEYLIRLYGTPKIIESASADLPKLYAMFDAFADRSQPSTPSGIHLSASERAELIAMARPAQFTEPEWATLVDRLDSLQGAPLPADVAAAQQQLDELVVLLRQRGWRYRMDGFLQGNIRASQVNAPLLGSEDFPARSHYYYLKDHNTDFVRRGRLSASGKFEGLILNPEAFYTVAYYDPVTGRSGAAFFQAGAVGKTTVVPSAPFEEPDSLEPDTDQDGLADLSEEIIGTSPNDPDSDQDGVRDGVEVSQGTNPLDGVPIQAGPVATVATLGAAVDIAAFDRVAVVAEGLAGVSIFDTTDFLNPVRVAQIDTPGEAKGVAREGKFAVVADGPKGLAIIDVTSPTNVSLLYQVPLTGDSVAVAASGGLAYVGLANGDLFVVELASGQIIDNLSLGAGAAITDLIVAGEVLYVLAAPKLFSIPLDEGFLIPSVVDSPGFTITGFGERRLRLTSGDGLLYAAYNGGFNVFSLADPRVPKLLQQYTTVQRGWKQIVPNGSGLGVAAVGSAVNADGDNDVYLYNLSPGGTNGVFITTLATPGVAGALNIFNGLAYVADGINGLLVLNYLPLDTLGIAPQIGLAANFPLTGNAVAGSATVVRLHANVTDDVQVRNVEFYLDDQLLGSDGNFPFEIRFSTPLLTGSKTNFTVRARAFDTGGNAAWSDVYTIRLVPDAVPPKVRRVSPRGGGKVINRITVYFSELVDGATINSNTLQITSGGADSTIGTADDSIVAVAEYSLNPDNFSLEAAFAVPLPDGLYRVTVTTGITDLNHNVLVAPVTWEFRVGAGVFWTGPTEGTWNNPANWSTGVVPGSNDVVYVDLPFETGKLILNQGEIVVSNLVTFESVEIAGGSITATGGWMAHKNVVVNGGTLQNGTLTLLDGSVLLPGVNNFSSALQQMTINGDIVMNPAAVLHVHAGLTLNGTIKMTNGAWLRFADSQTMTSGGIEFTGNACTVEILNGATLTLGSSVVISGSSGTVQGAGTLINQGRLSANVAGGHIGVQPTTWTHNGTAEVLNGAQLTFGGKWGGTGPVSVQNGRFNLGGEFGPLNNPVTKSPAGEVRVTGNADLQGSTVTLNGGTGSWIIEGGSLRNGTLTELEGAVLLPAVNNFSSALQQMTVNGDIVMNPAAVLHVHAGLTLNGTIKMTNGAWLRFADSQTMTSGGIEFTGNACTVEILNGATLTLGSSVVISGSSGTVQGAGTLINQGRVSANVAGGHIVVQPTTWTHNGTAEVLNGAQLTFGGKWGGTGPVSVQNGRFNLGGEFGPLNNPVTKSPTGEVRVTGNADLQGSTLTLNGTTGSWIIEGGSLRNGTLTELEGAVLLPAVNNFSSALQQMTVNGNIVMNPAAVLHVHAGLTLNGTIKMTNGAWLRFADSQTMTSGGIEFTGNACTVEILNGATLTLGSSVVISGSSGTVQGAGTLINQGRISANVAGGHIGVQPTTWTHNGTAEVLNGAQLTFGGKWDGTGPVSVQNGRFNLGGEFGPLNNPVTKSPTGEVRVTGNADLQGSTMTLNGGTGSWTIEGGSLRNGTLTELEGAVLLPAVNNFSSALQQMTVNGDIVMNPAAVLHVHAGLTLNGTIKMTNGAWLRFADSQTMTSGGIEFTGNACTVEILNGATLTLGSSVVISGSSGTVQGAGTLINQGRISANVAGGHILVQPTGWTHNGTAEVLNGAQLTFGGRWGGTGPVSVQNGRFNLGGEFGPLNNPVTKSPTGEVRVTGNADLQGSTMTLNGGTGSWTIEGGSLRNGTLTELEGVVLLPAVNNFSSALQQMTVNGDIVMNPSAVLHVHAGLTLNGTIKMTNGAWLRFADTQTMNSGSIEFTGTSATVEVLNGATLTLAAPVLVHGRSGTLQGASLVNRGKISADTAGGTIRVNPANFVNEGLLEQVNGGTLIAPGFP